MKSRKHAQMTSEGYSSYFVHIYRRGTQSDNMDNLVGMAVHLESNTRLPFRSYSELREIIGAHTDETASADRKINKRGRK